MHLRQWHSHEHTPAAICICVDVLNMRQMKSGSANQAASDFRGRWQKSVRKMKENSGHRTTPPCHAICGCILYPFRIYYSCKESTKEHISVAKGEGMGLGDFGGGISGDCLKFMTCLVHMPHNVAYIWSGWRQCRGLIAAGTICCFCCCYYRFCCWCCWYCFEMRSTAQICKQARMYVRRCVTKLYGVLTKVQ